MNKPHPRKGKNNRGLGRRVNRAEEQREPQIELTGKISVKNRRQHQERCDRETVTNRPSPKGKVRTPESKPTDHRRTSDVVLTSKLTDEEAKWIMETAQSFYLNDTRYKLLER
ncbi:hypothetical protein F2Q70_00008671 [Brassica cretica]|uniref:Uncharacterized protein n=1 Tax=Brassica cretica TaxID=69181 RepID=A0A8S9MDR0_BRACR|nr:hypothetical protein F2Q70_00008671 [Brassica cretica]